MKTVAIFSGVVGLVAAATSPAAQDDSSSLQLKIELSKNTIIKAVLTNNGDRDVKLLRAGSLLDENPVEKSQVFAGDERVESIGIRPYLVLDELDDDSFETIASGDSVNLEWDIAVNHDLSHGGSYNISSSGYFSYAEADSTEIAGVISFESNVVEGTIDGLEASAVQRTEEEKRVRIQGSCRGSQAEQSGSALYWCQRLAANAEKRARSGSSNLMRHVFKSDDSGTRGEVVRGFQRIGRECGLTTSGQGVAAWHCADIYNFCRPEYGAYASGNNIVPCAMFFRLNTHDNQCNANTKAAVALHEVTHLPSILNTDDICYGRGCVSSLSRNQALRNADSWSHFAQYAANGGNCY